MVGDLDEGKAHNFLESLKAVSITGKRPYETPGKYTLNLPVLLIFNPNR
jgi:hypothetical protein